MELRKVLFAVVGLLAWSCVFAEAQQDTTAAWKPVEAALGQQTK